MLRIHSEKVSAFFEQNTIGHKKVRVTVSYRDLQFTTILTKISHFETNSTKNDLITEIHKRKKEIKNVCKVHKFAIKIDLTRVDRGRYYHILNNLHSKPTAVQLL